MNKYVNQVTDYDCPLCDSKLTLRRNSKNQALFLGCQTYQTSRCSGSKPLTDEVVLELKKHFEGLKGPRQLSLLDKGHRRAYITLTYGVFDGEDDGFEKPIELGTAEMSLDNLLIDPSVIKGSKIFADLLDEAIKTIGLDQ